MKYEALEGGVIASFNRLIASISKRGDKALIKQMSDHTDKLELLLEYSKKRESDSDEYILELSVLQSRLSKLSTIFEMTLSNIDIDQMSNGDLLELNAMRKGRLYSARSLFDANSALDDKKWLKTLGFKFRKNLSLEELKVKINQCNQKIMSGYEIIKER